MEKDKTIMALIARLKLSINFALVEIVDYWEPDLCAIGVKRKDKLVYVSTYNYINEKLILYDYDLELVSDNNQIRVVKESRRVSEDNLIDEIKDFLGAV